MQWAERGALLLEPIQSHPIVHERLGERLVAQDEHARACIGVRAPEELGTEGGVARAQPMDVHANRQTQRAPWLRPRWPRSVAPSAEEPPHWITPEKKGEQELPHSTPDYRARHE